MAKEELYDALTSDELPENESLQEHDRKHHHGHFDPSTQTCKFREELAVETEADKADELDSGSDDYEDTDEFSEDFWATVNPERGSSYSSEFGEDDGEALVELRNH